MCTFVILGFRRQEQKESCEFDASLGYGVKLSQDTKQKKERKRKERNEVKINKQQNVEASYLKVASMGSSKDCISARTFS